MLFKNQIKKHLLRGDIVIDPFVPENLGSAQYDVTLGEHFYRQRDNGERRDLYNPFDEEQVRRKWVPEVPISHEDWIERSGVALKNIGLHQKIILIRPGELILAHTEEFIGGACDFITTMMKARSSVGRNGFEICRCAGMGDVGYFNRWTMEIANTGKDEIVLVPGRRYAQILFYEGEPVDAADVYDKTGKYQSSSNLAELKASWTPEQMLPRQWNDRECRALREGWYLRHFTERVAQFADPVYAAVAFVEREDGRILCVWNPRYGGWALPGGMREGKENLADAVKRELREETSVDATEVALLHIGPHGLPAKPGRASHVAVYRVMAWMNEARETEVGCPVTWLTRGEFLKWSPFAKFYSQLFTKPEFSHA